MTTYAEPREFPRFTGGVTEEDARLAVVTLLRFAGYNPDTAELIDTPDRVVRAFTEMTAGQWENPAAPLARQFPAGDSDELIAVTGIEFTALCEHHLMPFVGTATVAYIPQAGAPVVGLSKLPRLVSVFARRLTMQERMTRQVTAALDAHLQTAGSACIVTSHHACMGARGVRQSRAAMVTSSLTGVFRTDVRAREELLALSRG